LNIDNEISNQITGCDFPGIAIFSHCFFAVHYF